MGYVEFGVFGVGVTGIVAVERCLRCVGVLVGARRVVAGMAREAAVEQREKEPAWGRPAGTAAQFGRHQGAA